MLSQDKRIEALEKISLTNITRCSWAVAISTQRAGRRIETERDLLHSR